MFSNRVFIIIVVALFGIANADVIKKGKCSKHVKVVWDFDIERYMGLWHEYAKYPYLIEENTKCNAVVYSLEADGRVRVNNSMISRETGLLKDLIGYGTPVESAKFVFDFPEADKNLVSTNYWVIDTDYTSFSVAYACQQMEEEYKINVWILTRELDPPAVLIEKPLEAMKRNHISLELLNVTELYGCREIP